MQKKIVSALFYATGLMLTTAFSNVYGMEETKTESGERGISSSTDLVVYSAEQKQKAPATGLFTQTELNDLQHILNTQYTAVYSVQADDNEHAYLFVPNPDLIPYAQKIYDHLHEMSNQNNPNFTHFLMIFTGILKMIKYLVLCCRLQLHVFR